MSSVVARAYRESPDGKWLFAFADQGISRIPLTGGDAQQMLSEPFVLARAAVTSRGLYYLSLSTDLKSATLRVLPWDGGAPKTLGVIPHAVSAGLSVAPDFTSIIYSRCDQCAADIMLVEGFK